MMENKVLYDSYNNDEFTIIEHGIYKGRVWCIRMRKFPCAYFEKT